MEQKINAQVILCKCSSTHGIYAMRAEESSKSKWKINWAFAITEKRAQSEKYNSSQISGSFDLVDKFPGCPYCGNMSFFSCGTCGKLTCWNGVTKTVKCAHCGKVSYIEVTISELSTGSNI